MKLNLSILARVALGFGWMLWCAGCGHQGGTDHAAHDHDHGHVHEAPHGGTVVVLGEGQFHLEFVLNAAENTMECYVMDGHLERFIRINAETFVVVAMVDGEPKELTFAAQENRATGETIGDSAYFKAQADWLNDFRNFDATLKAISISGTAFNDVSFPFPEGHELKPH